MACFRGSKYTKRRYLDLMALMFDLLQKARREGLVAIEKDVEAPHSSPVFAKYPQVRNDPRSLEFMTDYMRLMLTGNLNAHEVEALMDGEIETFEREAEAVVMALQRLAGSLPAFGIVAAVLGVVNTMSSVGQPPPVLGQLIGNALVGTFLGILLSYAVFEPLAAQLEQKVSEQAKEFDCVRATLLASMQGYPPAVAIEFGRKVLYSTERPTHTELESRVQRNKAPVTDLDTARKKAGSRGR